MYYCILFDDNIIIYNIELKYKWIRLHDINIIYIHIYSGGQKLQDNYGFRKMVEHNSTNSIFNSCFEGTIITFRHSEVVPGATAALLLLFIHSTQKPWHKCGATQRPDLCCGAEIASHQTTGSAHFFLDSYRNSSSLLTGGTDIVIFLVQPKELAGVSWNNIG